MHALLSPSLLAGGAVVALAALAPAQGVVINEVYYDAPGSDNGQVFVELYGPAGTDISGWKIQGIEGTTSSPSTCNSQSFTFPANTLIPNDGFVVVADGDGTGVTTVANADFIDDNFDLENGPDAVQLLDAQGSYVDAVAYGPIDTTPGPLSACNGQQWYEGNPARDVFAPLSIERCPQGADSNDNAADFKPNVPSPGEGRSCCQSMEWVDAGAGNAPSVSAGEAVDLDFWFSPCGANQPYLVIAAFTDPASNPVPPPLPVFDATTGALAGLAKFPPFVGWVGMLDASGSSVGQAMLNFASTTNLNIGASATMYIGALSLDPNGALVGTRNYVTVTINP